MSPVPSIQFKCNVVAGCREDGRTRHHPHQQDGWRTKGRRDDQTSPVICKGGRYCERLLVLRREAQLHCVSVSPKCPPISKWMDGVNLPTTNVLMSNSGWHSPLPRIESQTPRHRETKSTRKRHHTTRREHDDFSQFSRLTGTFPGGQDPIPASPRSAIDQPYARGCLLRFALLRSVPDLWHARSPARPSSTT